MFFASPTFLSTAGFISDHRVLNLIYKPVVYFDVSLYRDICKGYNTARGLYDIYKNRGPRVVARRARFL